MIVAILLSASAMLQPSSEGRPIDEDLRAYREAAARLGRDAEAHVGMALWCEERGLAAERLKHLTRAVLIDPEHQVARGLLGQIAREGGWVRPEDVRSAIEADPRASAVMQEYLSKRASTAYTADAEHALARWCDRNGLADQASAHYQAVLRIDPSREAVWKKLGYKKENGRWMRPEDLAAERKQAEALRLADRRWRPVLLKLRDRYIGRDAAAALKAADALDAIDDPLAVPTIRAVFVKDDARLQRRAAETFARIDGRSASIALADLAVFSPIADVRTLAIDLLAHRDPRDFIDPLLDMIRKPFRYKVQPVAGVGTEGLLFAEGDRFNIDRRYQVPVLDRGAVPDRLFTANVPLQTGVRSSLIAAASSAPNNVTWQAGPPLPASVAASLPAPAAAALRGVKAGPAGSARPASVLAEAVRRDQRIAEIAGEEQARIQQARQSLANDVAAIEGFNSGFRDANDRVLPVVRAATGRDFGDDQDAWKGWWNDQIGYAYQSSRPEEKPTYSEVLSFPSPRSFASHGACFIAGTPVHTLTGLVPIEEVRVGDLVLSQDVTTGAVPYKPVLLTHINQPTSTLKLTMGSESIVATGIHRFWRAGKGWTMARDLRAGDVVRVMGGTRVVEAVEPALPQSVYNLDVAENLDFFVGRTGFLVHDFSIVNEPSRPFDAAKSAQVEIAARR